MDEQTIQKVLENRIISLFGEKFLKNSRRFIILASMVVFIFGVYQEGKKENEIKRQIESYEKNLPGYWEQKQQVEHYRDSLINARLR